MHERSDDGVDFDDLYDEYEDLKQAREEAEADE
jgi:hypothetical protein